MKEKKILIVDDEVDIRKVFEKAFHRAGYTVRTAASGKEALEILKEDKIQVMFFDLKMPEMDGLELCRKVRKDLPMAMIHAVTGYASLFQLADCREAGFDDYYLKPVELSTLLSAAADAFDKIERWMQRIVHTPAVS